MEKISTFFALMGRMKHIARWGLMRSTVSENVQEHTMQVAAIAHSLAVIGREVYHKDVDPGRVAAAALYHDIPEILTGDLPTPVKYFNPGISNAYKGVEKIAKDKLFSRIPEELAPAYRGLIFSEEEEPAIYRYVKAADKIAAYIKCIEEVKTGNSEFVKAGEQLGAAVSSLKMPEAEWFCARFLPAFHKSLDELEGGNGI